MPCLLTLSALHDLQTLPTLQVWRSTTQMGCAIQYGCGNGNTQFLVCRYSPPGNVDGQFADNVKAPMSH